MSSPNPNYDVGLGPAKSTLVGRPATSVTAVSHHQPSAAAAALRGASLAFKMPKPAPPLAARQALRRDNGALVAAASASAGSNGKSRSRSPAPPTQWRISPAGTGNGAVESEDHPTTAGGSAALVAAGGAFSSQPPVPIQISTRTGPTASSSIIAATLAASRVPSPSPLCRGPENGRSRTPGLAADAGGGAVFEKAGSSSRSFVSATSGASVASTTSAAGVAGMASALPNSVSVSVEPLGITSMPSTISIVSLFEGNGVKVDPTKRVGNGLGPPSGGAKPKTSQLQIDTRSSTTPPPTVTSQSSPGMLHSPKPRRPGSKPRQWSPSYESLVCSEADEDGASRPKTHFHNTLPTPHSSAKPPNRPPLTPAPPKPRAPGGRSSRRPPGWRHSSASSRGGPTAAALSRVLSSHDISGSRSRPATATTTSSDDTFVSASSMLSLDTSPPTKSQVRPDHVTADPIMSSQRHVVSLPRPPPSALSQPPSTMSQKFAPPKPAPPKPAPPKPAPPKPAPSTLSKPAPPKPAPPQPALALPKPPPPRQRPTTPINASPSASSSLASLQAANGTSLTLNSLTNAILAGSLATSRLTPTNTGTTAQSSASGLSVLMPGTSGTPVRQRSPRLKETLRQPAESHSDDDDLRRLQRRRLRNKPLRKRHAHHEGARKRWRDEITDRERRRYEALWASNRGLLLLPLSLPPSDHVVNVVVRELWRRSRLPDDELAEVWDLVDREGRGLLGKLEFVVGTWLVDQRLKGRKIPSRVSESVWTSGAGRKFVGRKY